MFSFVGFGENLSPAPPVGFNLTFRCPEGMVFDHDWFAVPFVMTTCQVLQDNGMIRWNCVYINSLVTASVSSFAKNANIFFRISHIFAKINFATGSQNMLSFVKRTDIRQFREKFKKLSPFLRDFALTCFVKKNTNSWTFILSFCYFSHFFLWREWEKCMFIAQFFKAAAHWNNLNDNSNSLGARNLSVLKLKY